MNRAQAKSKSKTEKSGQPATKAVPEVTLEEIVRLTGKDPLIALAEVASGKLECTGCNGAGYIQRGGAELTCPRCQGSKRETVPAAAMLDARYKLATFFYAPRRAVEASAAEGEQRERFLIVKFTGPDGDKEPERG